MFQENHKRWRNEDNDLDLFWERTFADTPSDQKAFDDAAKKKKKGSSTLGRTDAELQHQAALVASNDYNADGVIEESPSGVSYVDSETGAVVEAPQPTATELLEAYRREKDKKDPPSKRDKVERQNLAQVLAAAAERTGVTKEQARTKLIANALGPVNRKPTRSNKKRTRGGKQTVPYKNLADALSKMNPKVADATKEMLQFDSEAGVLGHPRKMPKRFNGVVFDEMGEARPRLEVILDRREDFIRGNGGPDGRGALDHTESPPEPKPRESRDPVIGVYSPKALRKQKARWERQTTKAEPGVPKFGPLDFGPFALPTKWQKATRPPKPWKPKVKEDKFVTDYRNQSERDAIISGPGTSTRPPMSDAYKLMLGVAMSKDQWKAAKEEGLSNVSQTDDPWQGVTDETPLREQAAILDRQLAYDAEQEKGQGIDEGLIPDSFLPGKAGSVVEKLGDNLDTGLGLVRKIGESAVGDEGDLNPFLDIGMQINFGTRRSQWDFRLPESIRDRLRPKEAEGDYEGASPYDKGSEFERSVQGLGYEMAALDSDAPVDMALNALVVGGLVTGGVKAAGAVGRGVSAARKASKAADEVADIAGLPWYIRKGGKAEGLIQGFARNNKPAQKWISWREWLAEPVSKSSKVKRAHIYNTARGLGYNSPTIYLAAKGQLDDVIKGTIQANPGQSLETTVRSIMDMFAGPLSIGLSAGLSGRRVVQAGTNRMGGTDMTFDEAVSPTTELVKQYVSEMGKFLDTYANGSAEEIEKATEELYGYMPVLTQVAMLRGSFPGVGGKLTRNTIGRLPGERGVMGRPGRTINERFQARQNARRTTRASVRAVTAEAAEKIRASQQLKNSIKKLNNEQALTDVVDAHNEANADLPDFDPVTYGDVAVAAGSYGAKHRLPREQARLILKGDTDASAVDRNLLAIIRDLPDEVFDIDTPLGAKINRVVRARQDTDRLITRDEMSVDEDTGIADARGMEVLQTAERISRGEVEEGKRENPLMAPEDPIATGTRWFENEENRANEEYAAHTAEDGDARKEVADAEKAANGANLEFEELKNSVELHARAMRTLIALRKRAANDPKAQSRLEGATKQERRLAGLKDRWERMSNEQRKAAEDRVIGKQEEARAGKAAWTETARALQTRKDRFEGRRTREEDNRIDAEVDQHLAWGRNPEEHIDDARAILQELIDEGEDQSRINFMTARVELMERRIEDNKKQAAEENKNGKSDAELIADGKRIAMEGRNDADVEPTTPAEAEKADPNNPASFDASLFESNAERERTTETLLREKLEAIKRSIEIEKSRKPGDNGYNPDELTNLERKRDKLEKKLEKNYGRATTPPRSRSQGEARLNPEAALRELGVDPAQFRGNKDAMYKRLGEMAQEREARIGNDPELVANQIELLQDELAELQRQMSKTDDIASTSASGWNPVKRLVTAATREAALRERAEIGAKINAKGREIRVLAEHAEQDLAGELKRAQRQALTDAKREQIKQAYIAIARNDFHRLLGERAELYGLELQAAYSPWLRPDELIPDVVETQRSGGGAAVGKLERRDSRMAAEGKVRRKVNDLLDMAEAKAERRKNRNVASAAQRDIMFSRPNPDTGEEQYFFYPDEIAAMSEGERAQLAKTHALVRASTFLDPDGDSGMKDTNGKPINNWEAELGGNGKRGLRMGPVVRSSKAGKATQQKRWAQKDGNEQFALVEKEGAKRLVYQQQKLEGLARMLEFVGKWSSRLTLGTNIGWLLTQPLAEMMTLAATFPNPKDWVFAWKARKSMMKNDPEAYSGVQTAASTNLGTDVVTTRQAQTQDVQARLTQHLEQSPLVSFAKETVALKQFGKVDTWKGSIIRELGAIMELEHNLKSGMRAAGATVKQVEHLKMIQAKLAGMTTTNEQWRYLYSDRGIKEGLVLTNEIKASMEWARRLEDNVDRTQGNWTAVAPGFEANLASVAFFYPFTRFSLNWVFRTYPQDHPVRAAALYTLGSLHSSLIAEIVSGEPGNMSEWAQMPIYNEDGEVVSLFGIGRFMGTANAALEMTGGFETPMDFLNPALPALPLGLNALNDMDQYGNPLWEKPEDKPGFVGQWIDRAANIVNSTLSLSQPYREATRTINEGFAAGQMRPGDNPDRWEALFQRTMGPVGELAYSIVSGKTLGKPLDVTRASFMTNYMWNVYGETGDKISAGKTTAQDKALAKKDAWHKRLYNEYEDDGGYWLPRIKMALEESGVYSHRYNKLVAQYMKKQREYVNWKSTDADYKAVVIHEAKTQEYQNQQATAAYMLWKMAKQAGLPPPELDEDVLKLGTELWQGRQIAKPDLVWDADKGRPVKPGSPNSSDPDPLYWNNTVPKGAKTWHHLGPLKNLAFEGTNRRGEAVVVKPGEEFEAQILDPWNSGEFGNKYSGVTKSMKLPILQIKEEELTIRIRENLAVAKAPLPKESKADKKARAKVLREGNKLVMEGTGLNDPAKTAEGKKLVAQAEQMEKATSGGAERTAQEAAKIQIAEDRDDLAIVRKRIAAVKDRMKELGVTDPAGLPDTAANQELGEYVAANRVKAPVKARFHVANVILTLKEQLNSAGGVKADSEVPQKNIALYVAAAQKHGLGPQGAAVLAAIHKAETSFSDNTDVESYAGAQGPMQFMPETWAAYGQNGDINNKKDAIDAAANYLKASGAPNNWYDAIFAYNRLDSYVQGVQADAEKFSAPVSGASKAQIEQRLKRNIRRGQAMGIYDVPDKSQMIKVKPGEVPGSKGDWMGTEIILLRAAKPYLDKITSEKRSTQSTASGGISDHWAGATGNYALDIGETDVEAGNEIVAHLHKELGLVEPYATGWQSYTSTKYPGYRFQIGWLSDSDHTDHVHVGAANEGASTVTVGPTSVMARAKQMRYPVETDAAIVGALSSGDGYGGGSSSGGGGGGGGGGAGGGGAPGVAWGNLQSFRLGSDPNQVVPLWGGGKTPTSKENPNSVLAESIAKTLGSAGQSTTAAKEMVGPSSASTMGLPTMPPRNRKKK